MAKISTLRLFFLLCKVDILNSKKLYIDDIINAIIWVGTTVFVYTYLFPLLGMEKEYGLFMLAGSVASWSIFIVWPFAAKFLSDLEGNKEITFQLTLPISSWLILVKDLLVYAFNSTVITLPILPCGYLILKNHFSFADFSFFKFLPIFIALNFFTGSLGMMLISFVESMDKIDKVWIKFLFPMWFFGGAFFSWKMLYKVNSKFAYLSLLNPFLYAMEGIRGSILNSNDYLPFLLCLPLMLLFILIFGFCAIYRLKKRLGFV